MSSRFAIRRLPKESGQTLVLVAVALVSLLGMAALAIDVTTLYVAKGELQRAADAAAVAAAKTFVDSGVTSLNPGDPAYATRQTLAQTMATQVINAALAQNNVSGAAPALVAATPDLTHPGNPQISVTLQRTNLPTFFARIWGTKLATVTATAVAEAYNPGNAAAGYPPIAPKCVKPLLLANQDPATGTPFVNATTGAPVATNVIGEAATLVPCPSAACPQVAGNLQFRPAQVNPGTANLCPGACSPPASDYETSIDCCDSANPPATQYICGTPAPAPPVNVDLALVNPQLSTETNNGLQCVTNNPSPDTLDPADLQAGTGAAKITAGSGPQVGNFVTTSRAIVTFPIIDSLSATPLHVVGFLQVFVDPVTVNPTTSTPVHILNVVGCGNSPGGGPPVLGGGYSPIPVRLIH
jgi:Putative Flp pilus-assembly TadE/G-like